ncbi:hypothetical protein EFA69_02525 [Rufibacter immobilis]|uniref:Outer membrane protein beta-barrel domain-containing protein n=2 Tax=Rufibacter immobilis TaxID=1348778 RepID=A0A3M9N348_9BACT|nr:hypothetical protein EFA69_02525 [Rufibacter immobilis]
MLNDRWAVGIMAGFSKATTETETRDLLPYSGSTHATTFDTQAEISAKTWEAGPFIRYYQPLTQKLSFFAHAGGALARTTQEVDLSYFTYGYIDLVHPDGTPFGEYYTRDSQGNLILGGVGQSTSVASSQHNETKANSYKAFLSPGIVFFPTPLLGLEITAGEIGYERNKMLDQKEFKANLSLSSLKFGLSFYLGRSKGAGSPE